MIGLIGFGSIGERHYTNLIAAGEKVVVFSARKDLKKISVVNDWLAFKKQGPFEAVFICNETAKHLTTLRKVMVLKPRAIFVEKPLSHSSAGLNILIKELQKKNISLWVGYNMQFLRPLIYIKKIIVSKKLGKILYVRAAVGQDLREWRKRDYKKIYSAKKKSGGGVLLDLVHDLNYPAWLLGESLLPKAALVRKSSSLSIDVEDSADSLLMTKSDTIVSVHQDYCRVPGKRTLEIQGEKGSVEWDSVSNLVIISTKDKRREEKFVVEHNEMYSAEITFFLKQLRGSRYFSNAKEAVVDIMNIEKIKKYGQK